MLRDRSAEHATLNAVVVQYVEGRRLRRRTAQQATVRKRAADVGLGRRRADVLRVVEGGDVEAADDGGLDAATELELVNAMLERAALLALPDDAVAKLRENAAALALSISPGVTALRNEAYATGFTAHGSR